MARDGVQDWNNCTFTYLRSRSEDTENSVAWSNCTTIYLICELQDTENVLDIFEASLAKFSSEERLEQLHIYLSSL